MKIGDEVYVHGYVDEIRYDDTKRVSTIIIRNDGGYFGTVPSEIDRKTEPLTDWKDQMWAEAVEQREHDILYEPTYDLDDGSM